MLSAYLKKYTGNIYRRQLIYRDFWKLNTFVSFLYDKLTKGDTSDIIKLYEWYNVITNVILWYDTF